MIHWFGLRVLFLSYVNAIFTLVIWNAPGEWWYIMLSGFREPLLAFSSWFFCQNIVRHSKGLSDTFSFSRFTVLGVLLPDIVNSFFTYHYTFVNGDLERVALIWLSDFITIICVAVPLLHFFRPVQTGKFFKLIRHDNGEAHLTEGKQIGVKELVVITLLFTSLSFVLDFDKYWFLYGIVATMIAVRNGFDTVVLANLIIFILNYILPLFDFGVLPRSSVSSQLLSVHIGMGTMLFTSSLIGRVITDLKKSESELTSQKKQIEKANQQLTSANQEMDRFVYSVSHDISAPLKSIKGLLNLSRQEKEDSPYLKLIETSVQKLEEFIGEVLDHSRTNRKEVLHEQVNLAELVNGITDNLKYLENFNTIKFAFDIKNPTFVTDKFLIKVVLSNLLSNAIKYQKKRAEQPREIKIESRKEEGKLFIRITDNGEGIADIYKEKIFEMFYRGTTNSTGSGLGLFIAKEAAEKLKGKIEFTSTYGVGSEFTITLPI